MAISILPIIQKVMPIILKLFSTKLWLLLFSNYSGNNNLPRPSRNHPVFSSLLLPLIMHVIAVPPGRYSKVTVHTGVYSALLQAEKEKTAATKGHTEAQQPTLAQVKFIVKL